MVQKPNVNQWSYSLLLVALLARLAWLVLMETRGAAALIAAYPTGTTMQGMAASTLPYVVYSSIGIVVLIILAALFRKRWAYLVGIIFGAIHVLLAASIVVLGMNPLSFGPYIVMTISALIVVFSVLNYRAAPVGVVVTKPA